MWSRKMNKKITGAIWCYLNYSYSYMTEESDDEDDGCKIVQHKLHWRSLSKLSLLPNYLLCTLPRFKYLKVTIINGY